MSKQLLSILWVLLVWQYVPEIVHSADTIDYVSQIKPLLKAHCFGCHGSLSQKSGLRLDTVELMLKGSDSGAVLVRGDPAKSPILERVSATDLSLRMPPHLEGEPLTPDQIKLLHTWILAGAPAPAGEKPESDPRDHWAFRPVQRPSLQQVVSHASRNPIDQLLAVRQHQAGIAPQPEATRSQLIRRLYLDLIGLPPTPQEMNHWLSPSIPDWYEQLVEQLLCDPRHGERWARHWMDIWRYSDWWGLGDQLRNSQYHIWHWRDWIIESLNQDTPYDEMVRQMLAADELYPTDLGKLRATGYLARNYFLFNRPHWMEETVEHVSKGFLGVTMNCARCHDHKFDPIEHQDFYRLRAFFEPYHVRVDLLPGEVDLKRNGLPRVYDGVLDDPTYRYIRGDEKNPDRSKVIAPGIPRILAFEEPKIEPVSLPIEAWQPERRAWVFETHLNHFRQLVERSVQDETKAKTKWETQQGAGTDSQAQSVAQAEFKVAQAQVAVARAELTDVEHRIAAQQGAWSESNSSQLPELTQRAVRSQRAIIVARAEHSVAVAELNLLRAAEAQKEVQQKSLTMAQESLAKAKSAADGEVKATDQYTRITGAMWTATRFLNSGKDDPEPKFSEKSTGRRTALAKWLTDRRNPLTARVAVNHLWTRHFGQPLVPTVFDFGRKGIPPTHPELVDWLAAEFMDQDWSMKHIHRLIVTSAAYRMSSATEHNPTALRVDPENRLLWHRVPMRIESQVVRDSLLTLGGTLDSTIGGAPILPAQQPTSFRRSLYFFHSNNDRNLFLTTFDEALVKDCYRREQSIVPQQALALSNSGLTLDAAERIAQKITVQSPDETDAIRTAFLVLLGSTPNEAEVAASRFALAEWRKLPNVNEATARKYFVWSLINHNDFVSVR